MSSDNEPLIGTWKLVWCFMEDVETRLARSGSPSGEIIRYYRIDGNQLYIEAALQPYANFGGKYEAP
jgi:hypothetical protein